MFVRRHARRRLPLQGSFHPIMTRRIIAPAPSRARTVGGQGLRARFIEFRCGRHPLRTGLRRSARRNPQSGPESGAQHEWRSCCVIPGPSPPSDPKRRSARSWVPVRDGSDRRGQPVVQPSLPIPHGENSGERPKTERTAAKMAVS